MTFSLFFGKIKKVNNLRLGQKVTDSFYVAPLKADQELRTVFPEV